MNGRQALAHWVRWRNTGRTTKRAASSAKPWQHFTHHARQRLRPLSRCLTGFQALIAGREGEILARCADTARRLLADPGDVVPLHGDIHHGNILDFGDRGWLAIDPKRLKGERGFDYANLFCNPDHPILGEHRMALCASPAFLAQQALPESLEALQALDAVAYSRHGRGAEWKVVVDGRTHALRPKARMLLDDMQGVLVAAVAGLGVAWLPYWLVRDALMDGQLQEVFPAASSPVYPIHAVWQRMPHLPLKTRVTVDALLQQLPGRLQDVEGPRA
ncbi:hypothetical protein I5U09_16900 [Stenotrophomonas maltophilia]|nr:hypothetical protein [Stenotrophomonas maltophilia]MBN5064274.1 hypothetical protein [Stenotrophomonas maltophilia]MCU1033021.1 hypothetical protein [Stenotrophomonas maltophilia]